MTRRLLDLGPLYDEASVQMYRPTAVLVVVDGMIVPALAYVLPEAPAPAERNSEYAEKLRALAQRLGLAAKYTRTIV